MKRKYIPGQPRKRTGLKIIIILTMVLVVFSTIGVSVIYLGSSASPTAGSGALFAPVTGTTLPQEETLLQGLGSLSDTGASVASGSVNSGSNNTGGLTTGSVSSTGSLLSGN